MTVKSILIVDDDPQIAPLMRAALKYFGVLASHQLVTFRSAEEALEFCQKPDADIALALLDNKLPGMHGFELFVKLHAHFQEQMFPVVFILADVNDPFPEAPESAIALLQQAPKLQKPILSMQVLAEKIQDLLAVGCS